MQTKIKNPTCTAINEIKLKDRRLIYKLVLFPSDNTIAVVKSKQCSPAEHDGFIFVQSGRKKFTGIPLEQGTFLECSQAAGRLTKKTVSPEIESDYERNNEENPPKRQKN
ncbi:hypothetical protein I4U23_011320 [Adineta vaga]|nr:hypothetical protein I4U23_011320 [Adineta vaga]